MGGTFGGPGDTSDPGRLGSLRYTLDPSGGAWGLAAGTHGGPMAEILTESFCERCGTRYTFQAGVPRRRGIGRIRTLTRGVKNFVANDNASFAEAMEAAREDDERTASARQLDAFHETFNFCMSCRQYTCRNCWNSDAGECLSCAPDLSRDVLPPPFPRLAVVEAPEPDHLGRDASAWPTSDLRPALVPAVTESFSPAPARDPRADATELAESSPDSTNGRPATRGTDLELTPDELSAIQDALARHVGPPAEGPTAAPDSGTRLRVEAGSNLEASIAPAPVDTVPPAPAEPLAEARAETRRLLGRFRPRREQAATTVHPVPAATRDAEVAEPAVLEPATAALPEIAGPEAGAAVATVEPAAAEPEIAEPLAAEAEVVEPLAVEPVAVEPEAAEPEIAEPEPAAEPAPAATPAPPPADHVAQPTWRMVAPEGAPPAQPASTPWPAIGGRRTEDVIPTAPWAARVAAARSVETPVWDVSSRDLLAAPSSDAGRPAGVQSCVTCGLSLSSNARFCRRCGTRQG
jgi:hypothetical protein